LVIISVTTYLIYLRYKRKSKSDKRLSLDEAKLGIYDSTDDPLDTWPELSMAVFKDWPEFLKLGVPGSLSLAMEWGCWEVNALIVARLPYSTFELAAHSVLANTAGLWYNFPSAVASAAITCIGNSLGAKNTYSSIIYCKLGFIIVLTYGLLNGFAGVMYRDFWGNLWTNDPNVSLIISDGMWIMWAYSITDGAKGLGGSVIRGCGHPTINLIIYLVSTFAVGYPISYVLGFYYNFRLVGIWIGMTAAWLVASVAYSVVILRTDWNKEVSDAIARTEQTELAIKNITYNPLDTDSVSLTPVLEHYVEDTDENGY